MKITKEASTFYALTALLKVCTRFIDVLLISSGVSGSLKFDLRQLGNVIKRIDRVCNSSLQGKEAQSWAKEWTDRDFEVYSAILFSLNDMSEEQRAIMEEFSQELLKGQVKMEMA